MHKMELNYKVGQKVEANLNLQKSLNQFPLQKKKNTETKGNCDER